MDAVQEIPPLGGQPQTEQACPRAGLAAELGRWMMRRSPSNVAHRLGISMARVRELRAGRFDGFSTDALSAMADRAGLRP
ncbi:hypothetical protein MBRA_01500 [Methylobacterium brachiatum]|nr:hypothetical protein MBRA_01500 [Methylobacterium brachiatum]